jgi:hypothetical protein
LKKTHHKKRTGGVAQGVGPEFKPQYLKQTNKQTSKQTPMTQGLCTFCSCCLKHPSFTFVFIFETGSCYVTQAGLELLISIPKPS